jgi:peptidoglycan/LPS O-acetylase OafA/YrhL
MIIIIIIIIITAIINKNYYNYHNSGHYPSSCLLFKTQLNSTGLSVPHRLSHLWTLSIVLSFV